MSNGAIAAYRVGDFDVQVNGIVRGKDGCIVGRLDELINLRSENLALKDFVLWMTGCGYDFCQHEYFIKQRDILFKA
jgi:hypothetical protein